MEVSAHEPGGSRPGDCVRIRRERWRVADVTDADGCRTLRLRGLGPANLDEQRTLLGAFEVIESLEGRAPSSWTTSTRRWRRACRLLLAAEGDWSALHCADTADLEVLPHQLEPALALVMGHGSRLLLADAVGLGKTIQAGLVIAELIARGAVEHVLLITPAGLRDQWDRELRERFGCAGTIVDLPGASALAARLPLGVNLWSTLPLAIASLDYVKRPEVLTSVRAQCWDLVVVDEAHMVTPDSERHAAVAALCASAAFVVLVTATPHSGDRRAFDALRMLGERGDPLLVFRRTRADVSLGVERRVHRLKIEPSAAELEMHAALERYAALVRQDRGEDDQDTGLLLTVLLKRALSSPESLRHSIARRLAVLAGPPDAGGSQMWLPLHDESGEIDNSDEPPVLSRPALDDTSWEGRLLEELLGLAAGAVQGETKLHALRRLLRRLRRRGEAAIVFTEYRDTLLHLQRALAVDALLLHGGLSRSERMTAVETFTAGRCPLLFATDAGGEGLNLHHHCRCVIHVELPWNPARLEQRMGRVDRIGQGRTVHAFYLVARHHREIDMIDRLKGRVERARHDIGITDPLVSSRPESGDTVVGEPGDARRDEWRSQAREEAARIIRARWMRTRPLDEVPAAARRLIARARGPLRAFLRGRVLLVIGLTAEDADGRQVASYIVPLLCERSTESSIRQGGAPDVPAIVGSPAVAAATAAALERCGIERSTLLDHAAFWWRGLSRSGAIERAARLDADALFQPGLFDRRADRIRRPLHHARHDLAAVAALRTVRFTHAGETPRISVRTRLVMLP